MAHTVSVAPRGRNDFVAKVNGIAYPVCHNIESHMNWHTLTYTAKIEKVDAWHQKWIDAIQDAATEDKVLFQNCKPGGKAFANWKGMYRISDLTITDEAVTFRVTKHVANCRPL